MKWNDGFKGATISSDEAKSKWPLLLLDFLESNLHFVKGVPNATDSNRRRSVHFAIENENAIGDPIEVSCT